MSERITTFTNDGLTFDVLDSGPIDGDVIVLLHGFPERASSWSRVARLLNDEGYRTLSPDQRGYSPGARPKGRRAYAMQHLASDVAALIRTVGGPVHVVGHDWGANVGWVTAATHSSLVRSLTAFSVPHPASFAYAMTHSRQGLKSWYMLAFQVPKLPELITGWRGGPADAWLRAGGSTPADIDRMQRDIVDYGALPGAIGWYRALPFADRDAPTRITVPTTMVWSDQDLFIGREALAGNERFVKADYELIVLPDVSHWIPTQAPEAASRAILKRVRSVD